MKQTDVSPAHWIFSLRRSQTLKRLRIAEKLRINVTSRLNQQALIHDDEKGSDAAMRTKFCGSRIDDESSDETGFAVEENNWSVGPLDITTFTSNDMCVSGCDDIENSSNNIPLDFDEACFNDYAEADGGAGSSGASTECSTHINANVKPGAVYKYDSMACLLPIRGHPAPSINSKVATPMGRKPLPWEVSVSGAAVVHVTSHTHLPLLTLFYEYFFLRFAVFNQQWPAIATAVHALQIDPPRLVEVYDLTAITQGWPRASLLFPSVVASGGGMAPGPQVGEMKYLTWDQFRDIFPHSFISALYSVVSPRPLGSGKPFYPACTKGTKGDGWDRDKKRIRRCQGNAVYGNIDSNNNNATDASLFERLVDYRFYEVDILTYGPASCLDLVVFY